MRFSALLLCFFLCGNYIWNFSHNTKRDYYNILCRRLSFVYVTFSCGHLNWERQSALKGIFKINLITALVPILVAVGSILGAAAAFFPCIYS